jgi:hypothetical protein
MHCFWAMQEGALPGGMDTQTNVNLSHQESNPPLGSSTFM